MLAGSTKFIKRCAQWIPREKSRDIPPATRGIYALLQYRQKRKKFDVAYIGMTSRSSVGRRLARHKLDHGKTWSHFSIFEVQDSVSEEELVEIEGFFREIYRKDTQANQFNRQKKCKLIRGVRENDLTKWNRGGSSDGR
jgi:hypothetical protein